MHSRWSRSLLIRAVILLSLVIGLLPGTPAAAMPAADCPTTITVTSTADSGVGSLRQAVADVCRGGTIDFGTLTGTITLDSVLTIANNITIDGPGSALLAISGGNSVQIFSISSGVTATIQDLAFKEGVNNNGGAIQNNGTLSISNSTFTGNAGNYGGAIQNNDSLSISNSTFSGNIGLFGAAINNSGSLTLTNTTISATITLQGAVYGGTLNYTNTIIANTIGSDCYVTTIGTNSNNLVEDGSCNASQDGDPLLGSLGDYGGSALTFPLLPGSLAIDAGSACETTDQRGTTRGTSCDIGAFESGGFTLAITGGNHQQAKINTDFTKPLALSVTPKTSGEPVDGGQITFTAPASGASLSSTLFTASITSGAVSQSVTANAIPASYIVYAAASGANTLSYSLGNIASPTLATGFHNPLHNPIRSAMPGDSLHPYTQVTGIGAQIPTGTLTLTAYPNTSCSGSGTALQPITLDASGLAHPSRSALMTEDGLAYKSHYSGDAFYSPADGTCAAIWKSEFPTLLEKAATTLPNDGASLAAGPATLTLQFSQDMLHTSPANHHSVTYPLNYLLVEAGANQIIDTHSCGPLGLHPDDQQIVVNSVSYDQDTFRAILKINNAKKLESGSYRLFICGTTTIWNAGDTIKLNNGAKDSTLDFAIQSSTSGPSHKLPKTGFAPAIVTNLPQQPAGQHYTASGLWLEITRLGVRIPVVGVPQTPNLASGWDVTWLGSDAGYLEGTAYPTWNGNSVLTGHVTLSNGKPGPFAKLSGLTWGDQLVIHAWGQRYIYAVRSVDPWVNPNDTSLLTRHETNPWLTLFTCHGYNALTDSYDWRTAVRAVLVSITDEP